MAGFSPAWPLPGLCRRAALADRLRRIVPFVNRLSGALLVIAGLYIAYYSVYEVRLFEAEGRPEDPLLAAAGRLQCALAGGAHRHGAWPWLVALVVLLITGSVWGWRRHRAAHGRRDT